MRGRWVSVLVAVLVAVLLGPSAASVLAGEDAEVKKLQRTVSALEGRIRRLESQVRVLEKRLASVATDRDQPAARDALQTAILKTMYQLAEHAEVAKKDAELMQALADAYREFDKADRDRRVTRRGPRRTDQPRRTGPPDADTHRPTAMLGVALEDDGKVIHVLPGTPAEEVRIKEGDVIKRIDGRDVDSAMDIVRIVANKKPGDRITIELLRGEEKTRVPVVLAARPHP